MTDRITTSEAGLAGHPDKVADFVGDSILDAFLAQDPESRVGCQVMLANDLVVIGGQITSRATVDIQRLVREVLANLAYTETLQGISPDGEVIVRVTSQSPTLSAEVSRGGAGDSAIVVGYACKETQEMMPLSPSFAHGLARTIDEHRESGSVDWLRSDGKVQVTVRHFEGSCARVDNFVVSVQQAEGVEYAEKERFLWQVIREVVADDYLSSETRLLTRRGVEFRIGGPKADCGLSGRKVVADTYGGTCRHGGGGLSGKDPTKVDRWATYLARYIAKNLVAAGFADAIEVELAYAIGEMEPVAISVHMAGGDPVPPDRVRELIRGHFPLTADAAIEELDLRKPIYGSLSRYGHFGHIAAAYRWEQTDRAKDLGAKA